jgi:hypothetical protein
MYQPSQPEPLATSVVSKFSPQAIIAQPETRRTGNVTLLDISKLSAMPKPKYPNKFLDAAFHRFDGGNKQKEVRVRTSTVKRGVFLGSRLLKAASKNLFLRALQTTMPYMLLDM